MKATLTFDLPQESTEHRLALNGAGYYAALVDLDNRIRDNMKYEEMDTRERRRLELVRDWLNESLSTHGVTLEEP